MTAVKGVLWKVHFKRKTLHELRRNCRSFSQNSLFHIITINRTSICRVELHVLYFCQDVWWDVYFWRKKPTITSLITAIHFYNFLVMKFKSVFTLKMSGVVACTYWNVDDIRETSKVRYIHETLFNSFFNTIAFDFGYNEMCHSQGYQDYQGSFFLQIMKYRRSDINAVRWAYTRLAALRPCVLAGWLNGAQNVLLRLFCTTF